eukprot:5333683-Pleurochrysis_carterae.AAC.1
MQWSMSASTSSGSGDSGTTERSSSLHTRWGVILIWEEGVLGRAGRKSGKEDAFGIGLQRLLSSAGGLELSGNDEGRSAMQIISWGQQAQVVPGRASKAGERNVTAKLVDMANANFQNEAKHAMVPPFFTSDGKERLRSCKRACLNVAS